MRLPNFIQSFIESIYLKQPYNLAIYCQQTMVYNKNWWERIASVKYKNKECFLTLIDINSLKTYNDTYGHRAGDKLIERVANILKTTLPVEVDICRYGGDEFIVFSKVDLTPILQPYQSDFCFGIAKKYPFDSIEEIFEVADKSLYERKLEFHSLDSLRFHP